MNRTHPDHSDSPGSVMVVVMLMMAILALTAAVVLRTADLRYRYSAQATGWQEAIYSAEAGADIGVTALRTASWTNWTDGTGAAVSSPPPANSTSPPPAAALRIYKVLLNHTAGGGGGGSAILVQMDGPAALSDSSGQWYRIRSTGVAELPGTRSAGYEQDLFFQNGARQHAHDKLRRFGFRTDSSGGLLAGSPQAVRTIEVVVRPPSKGTWERAITAASTMNGAAGFTIDSYNSSDPTKSTNGQYDVTKRQGNGNVASDANGMYVNIVGGYLYGNLAVNGGTPKATQNVQGTISNTFNETLASVSNPSWPVVNATPTSIVSQNATLVGGTAASPQRYILSSLYMNDNYVLHLVSPTPGQASTIEIWCTKDVNISNTAQIVVDPEVTVNLYITGQFNQIGGTIANGSGLPAQFNLIGINTGNSTTPQWQYNATSNFIGTVYGTSVKFKVSGSANFFGAVTVDTVDFGGTTSAGFHFDEALLGGSNANYQVASWAESVQ